MDNFGNGRNFENGQLSAINTSYWFKLYTKECNENKSLRVVVVLKTTSDDKRHSTSVQV